MTKISFQGCPNVAYARPPGQIRGQKTEQTKILSTNRIQVMAGPVPGRGSRKNRKWNRPKFYSWIAPEYQVRPVGAILRPPPRARRPGCGSKSPGAESSPSEDVGWSLPVEREPKLTKLAFQGSLNAVQIRPPWSDPWTESGTDQNSIHEPDPGAPRPGPRRGSRNRKWNGPRFCSWVIAGSPGPAGRLDHAPVLPGPAPRFPKT
ncbi:hypothetical protein ACLKA6_000612 [Drosophila palustris]